MGIMKLCFYKVPWQSNRLNRKTEQRNLNRESETTVGTGRWWDERNLRLVRASVSNNETLTTKRTFVNIWQTTHSQPDIFTAHQLYANCISESLRCLFLFCFDPYLISGL